jgi:hypothetical protein
MMLEIADELRKIANRIEGRGKGLYVRLRRDNSKKVQFSNFGIGSINIDHLSWVDLGEVDLGSLKVSSEKWTKVKLVEVAE